MQLWVYTTQETKRSQLPLKKIVFSGEKQASIYLNWFEGDFKSFLYFVLCQKH